jgi:hypothetical protein
MKKQIENFPAYRISDSGYIETCWMWGAYYPGMKAIPKWKKLPLKHGDNGYIPLNLRDVGGKGRRTHLHRLLAEEFISPPPNKKSVVRHLDGNPFNNNLSNLAWGSYLDNENDKKNHGTYFTRITNGKLTQSQIREAFRLSAEGRSQVEISQMFGVSRPTISRLISGKTWR